MAEPASAVKTCPRCAEEIKAEALMCRYCRQEFAVRHLGYCATCHGRVDVGAGATCPACGNDVIDITVETEAIDRPPPTGETAPVRLAQPSAAFADGPYDAAMSHTSGTCEATAVTTRQWIGAWLALVPMGGIAGWAAASTILGLVTADARLSEEGRRGMGLLFAWSYDAGSYVRAYPPILLWVGLVVVGLSVGGLCISPRQAIRRAQGKGAFVPRSERRDLRSAARNLTHQLHERGRGGLFRLGRVYVRLGIGLVGVGLVLATAILAPMGGITPPGHVIDDVRLGWLPTVCLAGSLVALGGLLLSFPYGPREKVVVDASGNVSGADEPAVPQSVPPQPQSPAQV